MFEVDLSADVLSARRPLVVPGLYKINCDRHLWERAWILASPHDSVAVTDSQGEFTIKKVPAGRHQIRLWHEGWSEAAKDHSGRLEFQPEQQIQEMKVQENQETRVIFDDLAPAFNVNSPN